MGDKKRIEGRRSSHSITLIILLPWETSAGGEEKDKLVLSQNNSLSSLLSSFQGISTPLEMEVTRERFPVKKFRDVECEWDSHQTSPFSTEN